MVVRVASSKALSVRTRSISWVRRWKEVVTCRALLRLLMTGAAKEGGGLLFRRFLVFFFFFFLAGWLVVGWADLFIVFCCAIESMLLTTDGKGVEKCPQRRARWSVTRGVWTW